MATLYEIDRAILDCIDAETGEIIDANALAALSMERDEKIENVALWYKNLVSDAAQYKAEKDAFAAKEKAAKNKAESLKRFLDNALAGSSYKSPRVAVTFRKSEQIVVEDVYAVDERYTHGKNKKRKEWTEAKSRVLLHPTRENTRLAAC